jgi:alkylresorcinol/alkylpyrone synthase
LGFASLQLDSATPRNHHSKDDSMSFSGLPTEIAKQTQIAQILGLATASPEHSIDQNDAAIIAQEIRVSERWHNALPTLYRKSGVQRRGSVLLGPESLPLTERQSFYQPATLTSPFGPTTSHRMRVFAEHAGPLLLRACEQAIANAGLDRACITHLVTVSCTGFFAPAVDIALIQALGLDSNIQRTHVGFMGCHGALNAIRIAKSIVESDSDAVVLLGAIELCSLHQQYTDDAQQLVANSLFADGAASLVIGSKLDELELVTHDSEELQDIDQEILQSWSIASTLSKWIPETTHMMSWSIGDHGFRMSLDPQVPSVIEGKLEGELRVWLQNQGLDISEIEAWAIHPGGPRIIQAAGKALKLPDEYLRTSQAVLANHGNMSSPTVLFILERLATELPQARTCVLLAFGPGLCIEAVLLRTPSA